MGGASRSSATCSPTCRLDRLSWPNLIQVISWRQLWTQLRSVRPPCRHRPACHHATGQRLSQQPYFPTPPIIAQTRGPAVSMGLTHFGLDFNAEADLEDFAQDAILKILDGLAWATGEDVGVEGARSDRAGHLACRTSRTSSDGRIWRLRRSSVWFARLRANAWDDNARPQSCSCGRQSAYSTRSCPCPALRPGRADVPRTQRQQPGADQCALGIHQPFQRQKDEE